MKLSIYAVGKKMPDWVQTAYLEYDKRLPKELSPRLVELSLAARNKNTSADAAKKSEGEQMLAQISSKERIIALDVKGKALSTEQLSSTMQNWLMNGEDIGLLIGGPDGLSRDCLDRADQKWSLSNLTLPHPLVRVLLIEQLYRAWTILQNHPYHK
jgi:23S rRNA (pseudouridine1915-N3)-methyltransferase